MSQASELREEAARYREMARQVDDTAAKQGLVSASERLEREAERRDVDDGPATHALMHEIYASENGDAWFLVAIAGDGPRVVHQPNLPSGGRHTAVGIDTFLATNGRHTPQHQGFLRLVARLMTASPDP